MDEKNRKVIQREKEKNERVFGGGGRVIYIGF